LTYVWNGSEWPDDVRYWPEELREFADDIAQLMERYARGEDHKIRGRKNPDAHASWRAVAVVDMIGEFMQETKCMRPRGGVEYLWDLRGPVEPGSEAASIRANVAQRN
jgi:hypothetical protein